LIKSDSKEFQLQINALSNFLLSKNPAKKTSFQTISDRSCDTEDWSNDAENTTLITGINYILLYIHIEISYFKL